MGEMKQMLLQIQQQMKLMTRGNELKPETAAPSVSKTAITLDPHPISDFTAAKFTKKSTLEFPKYADDEYPVIWI